jgi:hypothetical protein
MKIIIENRWKLCHNVITFFEISYSNYFEVVILNFAIIFYIDN